MEGAKCKSCGAREFDHDEENDHVVCTGCGQVQENSPSYIIEGDYHDYSQACHAGGSFNTTFATKNYRLANSNTYYRTVLHKWKKYIHKLCERMQIANKQMYTEAADIFERAFKINYFKNMHRGRKIAVCVSCVYITCRLHDWPIMITNLLGITDTPRDTLMKINKELIEELQIDICTVSIEDYVPTCLRENGLTDDRLTAKTLEVIALAKELWLNTGRRIDALVLASYCIAWQTSNHANYKKSLKEFGRSIWKKQLTDAVKKRHKELRELMAKIATKVPWVSKAVLVKKNSWMFFFDDILKYKNSLLSYLEPPDDLDDTDIENQENTFLIVPPAYEASVRKRKFESDQPTKEEESSIAKSGHETRESLYNPELSEKDIPDSELALYIKTPKEVKLAKELALIADIL